MNDLAKKVESLSRQRKAASDKGKEAKLLGELNDAKQRHETADGLRKLWADGMASNMRGYLNEEQNERLFVIEARRILPKEYVKLKLTDEQLTELLPTLRTVVPAIAELNAAYNESRRQEAEALLIAQYSSVDADRNRLGQLQGQSKVASNASQSQRQRLAAISREIAGRRTLLEKELGRALDFVLTDSQKKQLKGGRK